MERLIMDEYLNILGYDNRPEFLEKYLNVPSLLRLKNVGYFCGMDYASSNIYDFKEKITRYDHSLTVALITWMLTKDIRATLAGLFHDISTPCFSHVIDYMNKDYINQESTEEKTEDVIKSDKYLCECLAIDNIKVSDIADFKQYSIVDLDRPMLCADRLDGIILTGLFWTKSIDIADVRKIIDDIVVFMNERGSLEIGLNNNNIASLLVETNDLIDVYCHSKEDNYMMELLASITKRAIEIGLINYDDLFILDEDSLVKMFGDSVDIEIQSNLDKFMNIGLSDVPVIDMPFVKKREIKPLIGNKRFKK